MDTHRKNLEDVCFGDFFNRWIDMGILYSCLCSIFFLLMNIHCLFSKKNNFRNFLNKVNYKRMIWNFHALGMWWRLAAACTIIMLLEAAVHSARGLPLPASPVAAWALGLGSDLSRGAMWSFQNISLKGMEWALALLIFCPLPELGYDGRHSKC